jgi:hypothetical protein
MAAPPEVKIKLTAEDQGVAAAIKNLTAQLQSIKDKEAEVADSTLDLADAFTGLIAVLGVEKLAEFGSEVFNAGVKIARLSQVTGVSSETLSVYSQAAKDAGGNSEQMQSGIQKLSTVLTMAAQGSQRSAKALAMVGLSAKDFNGLNADQKIKKVFDAIASLPPACKKRQRLRSCWAIRRASSWPRLTTWLATASRMRVTKPRSLEIFYRATRRAT